MSKAKDILQLVEGNYLKDVVVETAAAREMEGVLGKKDFDKLASMVKKLDALVDKKGIDISSTSEYFPIDNAEAAWVYLSHYAEIVDRAAGRDEGIEMFLKKRKLWKRT